jgi:DNA-binding transcriptional regulator WhiA
VLWGSRRQPIVTKSTMAAEYVAASQATDQVLHFMKLERDLGIEKDCIPMLLKQDNQATARSLVNPIEDGKSKYLDIHFHYVREIMFAKEFRKEKL